LGANDEVRLTIFVFTSWESWVW